MQSQAPIMQQPMQQAMLPQQQQASPMQGMPVGQSQLFPQQQLPLQQAYQMPPQQQSLMVCPPYQQNPQQYLGPWG